MRPKKPTNFDLTPESYYEHNRYFNEAEELFDEIQEIVLEDCDGDCSNCWIPFQVDGKSYSDRCLTLKLRKLLDDEEIITK